MSVSTYKTSQKKKQDTKLSGVTLTTETNVFKSFYFEIHFAVHFTRKAIKYG